MTEKYDIQIGINLQPHDVATIDEFSVEERKKPVDVIRNLLEDVMDKKVPLTPPEPVKKVRKTMTVRVTQTFDERLRKYKDEVGLSADKIVEQALITLRNQRKTGQDLLDGIDALTNKHRHIL